MWLCFGKASMAQTIATFRAEKFEPWRLLGDYALIDQLAKQYPGGFDITVSHHGIYHFRPTSVPQDPSITSYGIYVCDQDVYRITSSLYGKKRKPRTKKGEPGLGTSEEKPKT